MIDYGDRYECPACGAVSKVCYRCQECGFDFASSESTTGQSGRGGGSA